MKIVFSFFALLLCCFSTMAQGWLPMSAQSAGVANATVAVSDVWSVHHNPAAIAFLEETSFGVSYQNRFLLKELQSQGITGVVPIKTGAIGFGAQFYGYEQFRTTRVGAGYSLKLAENFSAGIQLNYLNLSLNENYGSKSTLTAEFGLYGKLSKNWAIGFSVFNLNRAKLSSFEDDRFSTIFRLGTAYNLSEKVVLLAEFQKDIENPLVLKGGIAYQAAKNFFIRVGASSAPMEFNFGLGYKINQFELAIASSFNHTLGFSPSFNLNYSLK